MIGVRTKLRNEKNLDGDEGQNAEAGAVDDTQPDPFDQGEETLIQPQLHHHRDMEGSGDNSKRKELEGLNGPRSVPRLMLEKRCCLKGRVSRRPSTILGQKEQFFL